MWLVCVDNGVPIGAEPLSLSLPMGLESGQRLSALLDDSMRTLRALDCERIVILAPESNNRLTYAQSRRRVVGETLLCLAAAQVGMPCEYVTRSSVRSILDLPRKGALGSHTADAIPTALAPHWAGKRDLAALAALAEQRRSDA